MSGGLYEQVLAKLDGDRSSPELPEFLAPRIKASASVVLWRRGAGGTEVFWVRRSPKLAFMGGWHAFPGGGRARADSGCESLLDGVPQGLDAGPETSGMPSQVLGDLELEPVAAPGIVPAALRELFEETGVLVGAEVLSDQGLSELDRARQRLLDGETDLSVIAGELNVRLDASSLVFAGRWLTPPLGPVRFDNRFFLLEWPVDQLLQPQVVDGELVMGEWITPQQAIESWNRGEVITAPPILHILKVLDQEDPESNPALERLRDPAETNLGAFRRLEFRPGIHLFPMRTPTLPPAAFTNAYIVGHREAVLIDPGSPYESVTDDLIGAIRILERKGMELKAIWLTHHHRDHIGGVERMRRYLRVPVWAHSLTAEKLESAGITVNRHLEDGQRVRFEGMGPAQPDRPDLVLKAIHTPGHAPGHMVFLEETCGSLIAGDLVAGFGTIVVDPPQGDMTQYLTSLETARALGAKTVFPAHGPTLSNPEGVFSRYIKHRLWREALIEKAWADGVRDAEKLLEMVYAEVLEKTPMARPLAARQLEAHMIRLRALGRV